MADLDASLAKEHVFDMRTGLVGARRWNLFRTGDSALAAPATPVERRHRMT